MWFNDFLTSCGLTVCFAHYPHLLTNSLKTQNPAFFLGFLWLFPDQPAVRPVSHGAAVQRPGGDRHPGGGRGDNRHHHAGPHLLRLWGDPLGPPLRPHSNRGGGRVLGRLLQVWKHSQSKTELAPLWLCKLRFKQGFSMSSLLFVEGKHARVQCAGAGWEAFHPDPDSAEKWAVPPKLAEEAQLHATQQLHAEKHSESAQEQLRTHQSPVFYPGRWCPEPECRHLTRGLLTAGPTAPPGEREGWCLSCVGGFHPCPVSCLIQTLSHNSFDAHVTNMVCSSSYFVKKKTIQSVFFYLSPLKNLVQKLCCDLIIIKT